MVELSYKEKEKQIRREAKKRFRNPNKAGDILHHSWGYDQTNCDFYQVAEVKPVSVVLKKIAAKTVAGSEGFMSQSLMPGERCVHHLMDIMH